MLEWAAVASVRLAAALWRYCSRLAGRCSVVKDPRGRQIMMETLCNGGSAIHSMPPCTRGGCGDGKKYTLYSVDEILKPRSLELSLDPRLLVEGGFLGQSGRLIMLGN